MREAKGEIELMTLPESYYADCKHLRQLLNSTSFEGTPEQRKSLLGKLNELEGEFSNISLDKIRENYKDKSDLILPEWNRRYGMIKLQVYKTCGYTRNYDALNKIFE